MNLCLSFESEKMPVSIRFGGVYVTVKPVAPLIAPVHIAIDVSNEEE